MATVTIHFDFSDNSDDSEDFTPTGSVLADIADYADTAAEERGEEYDSDVTCDGWEVWETDLDYDEQADWNDFDDLDAWGEYCEDVDSHGEAYVLRYADIGEHNFEDGYEGCFSSAEEYAQDLCEQCGDIPSHLSFYIDWPKYTSDLMMDCSEYDGSEGTHIFRD